MKTIYAKCVSSKEISLSKAAKILSKFVSADNGASPALNAYLRRSSAAFNELNHLHKELKKKKKTNQELINGRVKSKNVVDDDYDEKSTVTGVKLSQEQTNGSVNESGNEKHKNKKNKIKKEEIDGDSRVEFGEKEQNDIQSDHNNSGMKDKIEKKKNKHKGQEQQKETESKLSNNVKGENGGLKMEQRKKRKFENVEDKSGDLTDKRIKRKH